MPEYKSFKEALFELADEHDAVAENALQLARSMERPDCAARRAERLKAEADALREMARRWI